MSDFSDSPLVSVIIPCYNHAHFLGEAIESVLSQEYPNTEVVVIDDGSTDNTAEVAAGYSGVKCIQQPNRGISGARNTGMRHARANYLVFLDADDRLLPDAVGIGVRHLNASPAYAFTAGGLAIIDKNGEPTGKKQIPRTSMKDMYAFLLTGNHIWTPACVMFRRAPLGAIGGFDGSLSACADYDVYLKLARAYPVHLHNKVITEYRKYSQSMSGDPASMLEKAMGVMQRQLPYLDNSPLYKKAYAEGLTHWREIYGPLTTGEIKEHILTPGERMKALQKIGTLMRYAPVWTIQYSFDYIRRTVSRIVRSENVQRSVADEPRDHKRHD